MKYAASCLLLLASAAPLFAASPLFPGATESKWAVTQGTKPAGTITLLTSSSGGTRAEFRAPSGTVTTLLGGNNTVWLRASGGDVELATISAATPETTTSTALLLPFTAKGETPEMKDGKVASYKFRGAKATYSFDAKGPSRVDIDLGGQKYTLMRTSLSSSSADTATFAVRPKKGAASKLARLSGDLLGPSDTSVSATAGGRGAGTTGLKLKDGGDYAAVEKLEKRDKAWKAKLDDALTDFQKSGRVGKAREDQ